MAQLIKSSQVLTQDGEILLRVVLELNINLNTGGVSVAGAAKQEGGPMASPVEDDVKAKWAIPDFSAKTVKFGKTETT